MLFHTCKISRTDVDNSLVADVGWIDRHRETATAAACISLGAVAGALARMVLAQVFGEACANPGTVGWLSAGAPLCVTVNGAVSQQGGMVFSDLPSNMVGCFLMGLFQDGNVLGLATPMAIAWLPPRHAFQTANVWHIAFKTGFCGSLTTLSSWNSAMVVLMFGIPRQTAVWSAIFGYIIGIETALGSFVFGCTVARVLHRWMCPVLAAEADACHIKREQGVHLNRLLPDFERRFLHSLDIHETEGSAELYSVGRIDSLRRWRSCTVEARRVGNPLLPTLLDIENALFVSFIKIPPESESIARAEGWDLESLLEYVSDKESDLKLLPSLTTTASFRASIISGIGEPWWTQLPFVSTLLFGVVILLVCGLILVNARTATAITNRTMIFAMLIAPSGALARWKLSPLNGNCTFLPPSWQWLPLGTMIANIVGSIVSIVSVSVEYRLEVGYDFDVTNFWSIGTLRAVKIGFAGCLTTVSTFVAEINGFMRENKPNHAYTYMLTTLGICCVIASAIYACIAYFPKLHML